MMVMVTLNIPKKINKGIEHFKIEKELQDKRDAIIILLEKGLSNETEPDKEISLDDIYNESKNFKRHNLTPRQIEAMDSDIYD